MNHDKRVAIIGHFGGNEQFLDGQTVKTKTLYNELLETTNWRIQKVDTYFRRKNPVKLVFQTVRALITSRDIIIITSQNGRRVFFPILYFATKVLKTRVFHDVIGGRLAKFVEECPSFRKYLNSFQVNWVETERVKNDLDKVGVHNSVLLPNFKKLQIAQMDELLLTEGKPFKLCVFSRVMQEKGIGDAVAAVIAVNEMLNETAYSLDIYGPVDPQQEVWFENLKEQFPDYIRYCGAVHYKDSVETLKGYFALLFPTRYYTEGVPGTIIDAYAAGVPVIASQWESFSDVIEHGVTGFGFKFGDTSGFVDLLIQVVKFPERITNLIPNCLEAARYYLPEKSVRVIVDTIDGTGNCSGKR